MNPLRGFLNSLSFIFLEVYFIFIQEREGERKRNINVTETPIGCLLHAPQWGIKPATQVCALTGNLTGDRQLRDSTPIN